MQCSSSVILVLIILFASDKSSAEQEVINSTTTTTAAPEPEPSEDDNVCVLYTGKNFTGGGGLSPLLSLGPTMKVFETNLLFFGGTGTKANSKSVQGVPVQSVKVTKENCSVILCDGKHLEGNCVQITETSADISGGEAAVYKNVRSIDCHCEFIDPNDIVRLPNGTGRALQVPLSGKLNSFSSDDDDEKEGYPPPSYSSKSVSSSSGPCVTLFRDWHYKGRSFSLEFAGSAGKIDLGLRPRVRSMSVRNGCTVTMWGKTRKFSGSTRASFLEMNGTIDDDYPWACCSCEKSSETVCENAQRRSNQLNPSSSSSSPMSQDDFSQFVNYGKKIIGIGRNYRWTKVELAKYLAIPKEPIVFLKPTTSYIKEGETIQLPKSLGAIFYELELGVVIGKRGRDISESKALEYVAGYFLALDMTAKEFIKGSGNRTLPWEIGKGFDTACPVGDFIPKSQVPDPNNLHLECMINGEVTQSDSTSNMIFNVQQLIAYVSKYMTLEPHDVILTGTPDGFGPLKGGDVVDGKMGNITSIHFTAAA